MNRSGNIKTIGSKIYVDFPSYGFGHVPAKVDTGAYTSSIWASNIHEEDGRLYFTLFGPESPLYTEEVISTKDYQIRSIKNSFGQTEDRYVVNLRTAIEGKIIRIRFSLANRAFNTFPVLIGRRTLRGKFLVDVTAQTKRKKLHLLVFNEKVTDVGAVRGMFKNIDKKLPHASITMSDYGNLKFSVDKKSVRVELLNSGKNIADFDLVFFKTSLTSRDIATVAASYLASNNVPIINSNVLKHFTNNKLKQYITLAFSDVRIPKTCFIPMTNLENSYNLIKNDIGTPFILKSIMGKKGRTNFLVGNEAEFRSACQAGKENESEMVAQEYIPNDGDYRMLVMGPRVRLIIHRQAAKGTHVNNTSAGGHAALVDSKSIPSAIQNMAAAAAKLMKLDISGVDMIQDKKTGKWYCLEVNVGPQLATGAFIPEKEAQLKDYIEKRLNKLV